MIQRQQWKAEQPFWDARKLVFIDETGVNTKMARRYGRSAVGERCLSAEPHGHWQSSTFLAALRHDQKNLAFNLSFRQLLHVSFKVAAKKGDRYLNALKKHEAIIARNVTENLFERHMKPLLLGDKSQGQSGKTSRLEAVPA